jgi:hypothetical protein
MKLFTVARLLNHPEGKGTNHMPLGVLCSGMCAWLTRLPWLQACVALADLEADGDVDLVVYPWYANALTLYLNNGTGHFTVYPAFSRMVLGSQIVEAVFQGELKSAVPPDRSWHASRPCDTFIPGARGRHE